MLFLLLVWVVIFVLGSAARLVILIREICNDLINQATTFLGGAEILQEEPATAVEKLKQTLKVCGTFKSYYFDYKQRTTTDTPENPWRFQNSALFSRLDLYLERCHDILDLCETVVQFNKLEKIEIGGTKGKTLTNSVRQVYTDFLESHKVFKDIEYELLDVECKDFDVDFFQFRLTIKELERRLGAVISQAFDDCTTVGSCFKLMDSFEGLLDRELIQADLEKKHLDLMRAYGDEVRTVADLYQAFKEAPAAPVNSAPRSGSVNWVRGLKQRIQEPMEKLQALNNMVMETDEAKEILKLYTSLMEQMGEHEAATVTLWCSEIEATSEEKLKQSLIVRQPGVHPDHKEVELPFVRVNFDPLLLRLLREVKYFLQLEIEVPESALKVYERAEAFRQQTGNLELISHLYNDILCTLLDVERPLVASKLEAIDENLTKGLDHLNWNSHKIEEYIAEVMGLLKELTEMLTTIKGNVTTTHNLLKKWSKQLMFDRKEGKVYTPDELKDALGGLLRSRHGDIADGGIEIAKLLAATNKTLKVSKGAPAWKAYVEYVNEIVIDGFSDSILASLRYLRNQVDPVVIAKHETAPLLEISLELQAKTIAWVPEVGVSADGDGVRDQFNSWVCSFVSIGTLVKRLDVSEGNYIKEMSEDYVVGNAICEVMNIVLANEGKCNAFRASYEKFAYLWEKDLNATLAEFLEEHGTVDENGHKDEPSLEKFDEEVARYKAVQAEIKELPASKVIGWLKIDAKPLKQALATWVTKWIYLYTQHLSNRVVNSIQELYTFMGAADMTLDMQVKKEEPAEVEYGEEQPEYTGPSDEELQKALYSVMGCMRDVRKRTDRTDAMFKPLGQCVDLLGKYGIVLDDKTLKQLEEVNLEPRNLHP